MGTSQAIERYYGDDISNGEALEVLFHHSIRVMFSSLDDLPDIPTHVHSYLIYFFKETVYTHEDN